MIFRVQPNETPKIKIKTKTGQAKLIIASQLFESFQKNLKDGLDFEQMQRALCREFVLSNFLN